MTRSTSLFLLLLAGCADPTGPRDRAVLVDGWWQVTLATGEQCIGLPYYAPGRDTPAEAIADCRAARP